MALAYALARVAAALYLHAEIEPGPGLDRWNRIANVWAMPRGAHEAALRSFLARASQHHARSGRKEVVLVAGDSQLYGYFLPAPGTVAAFLAGELPRASVYNASKLSGTYGWARRALQEAIDGGLSPRVLVVDANPATQEGSGQEPGRWLRPQGLLASLLATDETLAIAADALRSRMRGGPPRLDLYDARQVPPGDGSYVVMGLRQDYYPRQWPPEVADSLRALLEDSRGKVDLLVVVASPHHYAPYNEAPYRYGWDTAPIVRESMALCAQYAHAACLDLSTAFGREYFHDVVHLNEAGHRRLAAEIAAAIRSRLGEAGPVSR